MSNAGARGSLVAAALGMVGLLGSALIGCASPAEAPAQSTVSVGGNGPSGSLGSSGQSGPVGSATSVSPTAAQAGSVPGSGSVNTDSVPPSKPLSTPQPPPVRPEIPSSPLLFPQAVGTLAPQSGPPDLVSLNPSDGQTRDGDPYRPLVFAASNLWLSPNGGSTEFDLAVDAGQTVGSATQVRVSYDLTGDGIWDRIETYRYFATDPEPGIERYTDDAGLLTEQGQLGELIGGIVQLEIWSALGEGGTTIDLADSSVLLPFS